MPTRPERLGALVVLLALLLGACRADVTVRVDAGDDGSGVVRADLHLDAEAVGLVGDLGRELRTDDLVRAGWVVRPPRTRADGSVVVSASKRFARPEQLAGVVGELSGRDGPLRRFRLEQDRGPFRTTSRLRGVVDLGPGLAVFGDEGIEEATGWPAGVDERALEEQLGRPLHEVLSVAVVARLPGAAAPRSWRVRLGQQEAVEAEATHLRWRAIAASGVALGAVAGLVAVLGARRRRARR